MPSSPSEGAVEDRVYSALPYEGGWRFDDVLAGVNTQAAWKSRHLTRAEVYAALHRLKDAGKVTAVGGWWRLV